MFKSMLLFYAFATLSGFGQVSLASTMDQPGTLEIPGSVQISPNNVVVQFCNNESDTTLDCQANVIGYLNNGGSLTECGDITLAPGRCAYAYVYANYPFFFVGGEGSANCQPVNPSANALQ